MPSSNFLWILMSRCLSKEASVEEENELMEILKKDEELQLKYNMLLHLWKKKEFENIDFEDQNGIENIIASAEGNAEGSNKTSKGIFIIKRISIAAALICLFVAGVWFWKKYADRNNLPRDLSAERMIETPNGNRTKILLPDGTSVWLNSGSKLSYLKDFSGPLREVRLDGEAYFDVIKNPAKPFIVHTGGVNIRVLGTAFDVKSYPEDKTVVTTLLRGLVQVTRDYDAKQKPVYLHPNEKIIIEKVVTANESKKLPDEKKNSVNQSLSSYKIATLDSVASEDSHIETAWVYNRLAFRGDNFEELAQKLEHWYNIKITFEDEAVKALSFNGSFENENVEQAFKALQTAVPFNYKKESNEIFISSSH